MSDAKQEVARLRRKRRGNRSGITKLVNEAEGIPEAEATDQRRLKVFARSLDEKLRLVESGRKTYQHLPCERNRERKRGGS